MTLSPLRIRRRIFECLDATGGGHYGGSLSCVEILVAILANRDIAFQGTAGDKLILSKGHAACAYYAALTEAGLMSASRFMRYATSPDAPQGHPDMTSDDPVCFSTGSLGQGLSAGLGMAIVAPDRSHFVILGDGECQEGQIWEAAMLAARLRAGNLIALVDANGFQELGYADGPPVPNLDAKFDAFGWRARSVDGHDVDAIAGALHDAVAGGAGGVPTVVICRTAKGKGCGVMEADPGAYHCTELDSDLHASAIADLSR